MDINHSSFSSEQFTSKQHYQDDFSGATSQNIGDNSREMVVNSDSHTNEARHSMKMSDTNAPKTLLGGSSYMIDENNSPMHNENKLSLHSKGSLGDECSSSYEEDSLNPPETSILQDDSIVEFSLDAEKSQETKGVMEVVLEHTLESAQENVLQSLSEKKLEAPESRENKDEPLQVQAKSVDKATSETFLKYVAKEQPNSTHLQNEISSLLSATSALCSPTSNLEVDTVEFSSTPKENLMRMLSDLLDECDWLKKDKAR